MEVDLPNILKRCSSAPVFAVEDASTNAINKNLKLHSSKPYEKEILPNLISSSETNSVHDKIMCSLAEKGNESSSLNTNSRSLSFSRSNSACSSPVRSTEIPSSPYNIFAPRARRYSASFATSAINNSTIGPRLTPRVSQLRQEECIDVNSREVNHEREVHSAMQMSQSWEDLTLVAENWSCKSEDLTNQLHLALPSNTSIVNQQCSSPSPTSRTAPKINLLSPSPTRRTFATRRSMSPIAMRPSQLGPVKRKFELEDGTWNLNYSGPPQKKKIILNNFSRTEVFNLTSSPNASSDSTTDGTSNIANTPSISSTFPPLNKNLVIAPVSPTIVQFNNSTNNEYKRNGIKNQSQTQVEVNKFFLNDHQNSANLWNKPNCVVKSQLAYESSTSTCSNSTNCSSNLYSTVSKGSD